MKTKIVYIILAFVVVYLFLVATPSGQMKTSENFSLENMAKIKLNDNISNAIKILGDPVDSYNDDDIKVKYYVFAESNWGKYIPFNRQFHASIETDLNGVIHCVAVKVYYPLIDGYIYVLSDY